MFKFLKQRNKDLKADNNNRSKYILTVSDLTVLGFCHLVFYHSDLFRASDFDFK